MTHLPECVDSDPVLWTVALPGVHYQLKGCICDRLRACEQRMFRESVKAGSAAYDGGYAAGVQAARDAVAALPGPYGGYPLIERADALAAIDALRGES